MARGWAGLARLTGVAAALALALSVDAAAAAAKPVDLRTVERTGKWNDALACPAGVCAAAADIESPAIDRPASALLERARDRLTREPRTELVAEDPDLHQLVFVQRSALWGFPDTVWVQAVETAAGSSVIVYSRSTYGYWDIGVNRARVTRWLGLLAEGKGE